MIYVGIRLNSKLLCLVVQLLLLECKGILFWNVNFKNGFIPLIWRQCLFSICRQDGSSKRLGRNWKEV